VYICLKELTNNSLFCVFFLSHQYVVKQSLCLHLDILAHQQKPRLVDLASWPSHQTITLQIQNVPMKLMLHKAKRLNWSGRCLTLMVTCHIAVIMLKCLLVAASTLLADSVLVIWQVQSFHLPSTHQTVACGSSFILVKATQLAVVLEQGLIPLIAAPV